MDRPRLYVDFNEMVTADIVLLSKSDSKVDSAGNVIVFYEGLPVDIYMDDLDENGRPDNLIASGAAVRYDLSTYPGWSHVKWCCRINAAGIRHASDFEGASYGYENT